MIWQNLKTRNNTIKTTKIGVITSVFKAGRVSHPNDNSVFTMRFSMATESESSVRPDVQQWHRAKAPGIVLFSRPFFASDVQRPDADAYVLCRCGCKATGRFLMNGDRT